MIRTRSPKVFIAVSATLLAGIAVAVWLNRQPAPTARKRPVPVVAAKPVPVTKPPVQPVDFDRFFQRFQRDTLFQRSAVEYPLTWLTWAEDDVNYEQLDTIWITRQEYNFEVLNETVGYYVDGQPQRVHISGTGNNRVVLITVEDSGIHIEYFFHYTKGWKLYRVEDTST